MLLIVLAILLSSYVLFRIFYVPHQAITFLSKRDNDLGIYLMRSDGSYQRRLSSFHILKSIFPSLEHNEDPYWSPDGTEIVYISQINNEFEIFTMSSNGFNKTQITDNNDNFDGYAVWSPDGAYIAFRALTDYKGSWYLSIFDTMDASLERLTASVSADSYPTWSPDSTHIAFMHNSNLYTIKIDGTGLTQLVEAGEDPVWSPNSDKIIFICYSSLSHLEICSIDPTGSNFIQLTDDLDTIKRRPVWSPDGRKIAFEAVVVSENNFEIFVMDSDGTNLIRLTHNPAYDGEITWSPDNKSIAFASEQDGDSDIYSINVDGSNLVQLTDNDVDDYSPSWRP